MYSPREAEGDRYIQVTGITLLAVLAALAVFFVSLPQGVIYGTIAIDQAREIGRITRLQQINKFLDVSYQDVEGNELTGRFTVNTAWVTKKSIGDDIEIVFNRQDPDNVLLLEFFEEYSVDFWMMMISCAVIIIGCLTIVYQVRGFIRFKKMMSNY